MNTLKWEENFRYYMDYYIKNVTIPPDVLLYNLLV